MLQALALAFGLAMDATAVSAARGLAGRSRELVILPLLFGGFQSGMAAIGWLAGRWAGAYIARWDHWVAFALLVAIGGKMLHDAWRDTREAGPDSSDGSDGPAVHGGDEQRQRAAASVVLYLGLAVATSIDAAAAGLTLPLVPAPPWLALVLIGTITAGCSAAGYVSGRYAGARLGARLTALGGLVLIAIGVQLLIRGL